MLASMVVVEKVRSCHKNPVATALPLLTPNDKSAQPQNAPAPFPNKSKKKGRDRSGRKRRK